MNQYWARNRERRAWLFTGLRSAFRPSRSRKQTSSASDQPSTTRMLLVIVKLLSERRDWNELKEQVQALSKKHGQLRESTKKMVGAVMEVWEAGKAEEDETEGLTIFLGEGWQKHNGSSKKSQLRLSAPLAGERRQPSSWGRLDS
ncbi:hypothetical protein BT69DRAFT_1319574 [Atractiella rhizophila]|nr:hypothetical protein BT69DRAFT_1319574 [Atractiella rhizophila]